MTKLGKWAPFIDEREMYSWYRPYKSMQEESKIYRPDGREMDPLGGAFNGLYADTVAYVDRSVKYFRPTYHHAVHFREVESYGIAAADLYAAGHRNRMPQHVREVLRLALYAHDAHHCASTLRGDAPRGMFRPELGTDVATEWVTAGAINLFMRRRGLSLPARLFQTSVIWASTYGGTAPAGKRLKLPTPQPRTIWGAIMRAADVCPPSSFNLYLQRSCSVNYGEVPAEPAPRTLNGFIRHSQGFARYIESSFDRLDELGGKRLTQRLGWRDRLDVLRRGNDALAAGNAKAVAAARAAAQSFGVQLT